MFPIIVPACETPNFTSSAYDFRDVFLTHKPKNLSWYAYDVVILSQTEVRFIVHDMRDSAYGGIGDVIAEFPAPVSEQLTHRHIVAKARWLAMERRWKELDNAEEAIIKTYTEEILAGVFEPKEAVEA